MQAMFNYFFDPNITTPEEAIKSIDLGQVGMAFLTGLLPGGKWLRSIAGAAGDVILYILDAEKQCRELSLEEILRLFALSLGAELIGDYVGDAVAKYGTRAVAKGLRELGLDELAEKILRQVDDVPDIDPCSFGEDTLVSTEEGLMSIDQVDVGDCVLAYDEETGEIALYPVTAVLVHQDPVVVLLTIDN
ncbi:MAG TPA: hypothetical protein VLC52_06590, partial [Anaerolineae bacterium]|nr:hypothetical protein [Anaerolineae bacterium]